MKNWKLFVLLGTALIFIFILIIFLLISHNSPSQTNQAISNPFSDTVVPGEDLPTFTSSCFKSYIQSFIANDQVSNPGQFDTDAQSCFTQTFITQWPSIISNSESDPVLLSQDYENSWENNISVTIASQNQTTATALVNIGTGSETMQLIAQLQSGADGWRISGVTKPS